jgi:hypothetical protein
MYIVLSRMYLARGSLTQRHYDIKKVRAPKQRPGSPWPAGSFRAEVDYYANKDLTPYLRGNKGNGERGWSLRPFGDWGKRIDHYAHKDLTPPIFRRTSKDPLSEYRPPLPPRGPQPPGYTEKEAEAQEHEVEESYDTSYVFEAGDEWKLALNDIFEME